MSVFIFAVILGWLIYQIVLLIQPNVSNDTVKVGRRIKVELPADLYLNIKVGVLVAVILLFLAAVVLVVAQSIHPREGFAFRFADALTSPRMGAAIFGLLVGTLLGNLMNRLLKSADDYKFKASDYLEIGLIAVLVILGIGGEEFLRSYANRINKISVGATTEISFSDQAPKPSRASAEQPSSAYRDTLGNNGGSAGLQKLYAIGAKSYPHISRDQDFIKILARYEDETVPTPIEVGDLPRKVLSPIAACLSGIAKYYGDATFIEGQLTLLSEPLHKIALGEIPTGPDPSNTLQKTQQSLTKVLRDTVAYASPNLKAGKDRLGKEMVEERFSCADAAEKNANQEPVDIASIEAFSASRRKLPYAAMAYASTMAALQHYESAAITMDDWINGPDTIQPTTKAERWYVLRARLTQTIFFEEWIRRLSVAASDGLRKYHIDNLATIADEMYSYKAIAAIYDHNKDYSWNVVQGLGAFQSGEDGLCTVPPLPKTKTEPEEAAGTAEQEWLLTLYDTYLSVRKDWVDHMLKHPTLKQSMSTVIESRAMSLMKASLKCIANNREQTRAEHIERYVRSELNQLENAASLKSPDNIRSGIHDAQQLLTLAFQVIDREVTDTKTAKDKKPIEDRISTDPVLEVQETLRATQTQLENLEHSAEQ